MNKVLWFLLGLGAGAAGMHLSMRRGGRGMQPYTGPQRPTRPGERAPPSSPFVYADAKWPDAQPWAQPSMPTQMQRAMPPLPSVPPEVQVAMRQAQQRPIDSRAEDAFRELDEALRQNKVTVQ
jgi:hypothetical protein